MLFEPVRAVDKELSDVRDHRIRRAAGPAKPLLLQGLERLEYRGYDSAGIALLEDDGLDYVRAVGNLAEAEGAPPAANGSLRPPASATRAGPPTAACHRARTRTRSPAATTSKLAIVLNGIVENYRELEGALRAEGHAFSSETDAEVIVHLIERAYTGDLVAAPCAPRTRSSRATSPSSSSTTTIPAELVGVRCQTPLVVGVGEGEMFLASSIAAFLSETRRVQFLEDARS